MCADMSVVAIVTTAAASAVVAIVTTAAPAVVAIVTTAAPAAAVAAIVTTAAPAVVAIVTTAAAALMFDCGSPGGRRASRPTYCASQQRPSRSKVFINILNIYKSLKGGYKSLKRRVQATTSA